MAEQKRGRGRPKQYLRNVPGKHGAPKLQVRLEPGLWDWVEDQGGSLWVRAVLEELRACVQEGRLAVVARPDQGLMSPRLRHPAVLIRVLGSEVLSESKSADWLPKSLRERKK